MMRKPSVRETPANTRTNAGPLANHQLRMCWEAQTPTNGVSKPPTTMMNPKTHRNLGTREPGAARISTTPNITRRTAATYITGGV
jgi:hypothetical protein